MRDERLYCVYILASKRNGTLYIGVTNDPIRRTTEHKKGIREGFTKKYGVHRLVWYDCTNDVGAAIQKEKQIKKWNRAWKIRMIEERNPNWDDLYDEVCEVQPEIKKHSPSKAIIQRITLDSRLRGNDKSESFSKGGHHKEDGPGRAPPRPLEMNGHKKFPISVLLDNVRSAYNVGSFFRTCDGAGISKLYLTGYTPRPPRRDITKTALGADASVPFEYASDPLKIVNRLKNEGVAIIAVETGEESVEFSDFTYPYPCCLVFGNEVEGIRPEILTLCDARVRIPMHGMKGSLNVVVSAGIIIYDAVTKYHRPS